MEGKSGHPRTIKRQFWGQGFWISGGVRRPDSNSSANHRQIIANHRQRRIGVRRNVTGMSAKQFQHFMKFHQQLAGLRRAKRVEKTVARRASNPAVAAAKEWLAGAVRSRSYSPSL
jgi:hypothetical protein